MRRTAIALALIIVAIDVGFAVLDEVRLAEAGGSILDLGVGAFVSRLSLTLASAIPWLAGALLLLRGRRGMGAMVLVAAAVLVFPNVLRLVRAGIDAGQAGELGAWADVAGDATIWLLALGAGLAAWRARPPQLREGAPGLTSGYTLLAFLAWLSALLASTQFLPPGSDPGTSAGARHFYELAWEGAGGLTTSVRLSETLLFGLLLLLAPRLRRGVAGALLLAVALPALIREGQTLIAVLDESFLIPTPASVAGILGLLGLTVIAVRWVLQDPEDAEVHSDPDPDPQRGGCPDQGSSRGGVRNTSE